MFRSLVGGGGRSSVYRKRETRVRILTRLLLLLLLFRRENPPQYCQLVDPYLGRLGHGQDGLDRADLFAKF